MKNILIIASVVILLLILGGFAIFSTPSIIQNYKNQTLNSLISNQTAQTTVQNTSSAQNITINNISPQTTCSYNEYWGCKYVSQGSVWDHNNPPPTVCGCFPNTCPSETYLIINGGGGYWPDGSEKGTYSCSDTQVS